jgi:multisubunit Na+/H+ antiporter MnhG subunit
MDLNLIMDVLTKSVIVLVIIFVLTPLYLYTLARLITLAIIRSINQMKKEWRKESL